MTFAPNESGLRDLLLTIEQSKSPDNVVQQQVKDRFELFNANVPEYASYLVYVLITPIEGVSPSNRAISGYLLVSTLRNRFLQIPPNGVEYLKSSIFASLSDRDGDVRRAGSSAINWLIRGIVPDRWPEASAKLFELMQSPNQGTSEAALSTFQKLCQDVPKAMGRVQTAPGQPFLDFLIPALITYLDSDNPKMRSLSLDCLVQFIEPEEEKMPPNAISRNMDVFLAALFKRASDPSAAVRKQVCTAMVSLLSSRPAKIVPEINGVVDYILHCTQDQDRELALEACEFWLTFAEEDQLKETLYPFLPRVAPLLLNCTVYTDDELFDLGALDDDDAAVPDRPEDIKPHFVTSKTHEHQTAASTSNPSAAKGRGIDAPAPEEELEDDETDLLDDDDDEDDENTEWTLRKCAAAALDVMATVFEADLMIILLPHLKEKLWSEDWLQRESGILTLGAMAEGCIEHLSEHLSVLIPYLITQCSDQRPLVRSIACWTLGRYSTWLISAEATPEHKQQFFVPALVALTGTLHDNNKKVQEAGCSAFATLEENAGAQLEPYLDHILRALVTAFRKYQQKNTLILYDAIGTLADSVGDALNKKELIDTLMPPLIAKWQRLGDDDEEIVPLLECMSSIVIAIGSGFIGYAQPVFERCVRIIHQNLVHYQTHVQNPTTYDLPENSFLIVALDLLSGLTQGLNIAVMPLYQATGNQIFQFLLYCMQYPDAAVRQSAYALLGDCAISIFQLLKPHLPQIMPLLAAQIEVDPKAEVISVCNNAAWAAGEISLQLGADMQPYVNDLIQRLIPTLMGAKAARSLLENAAVTIGRLGLVCPQFVAPHLEVFIRHWCGALAEIKDNDEKDSAFRGICVVIQLNPNGLSKHFQVFVVAVAKWHKPSAELNEMLRQILVGFKEMLGPQWQPIMAPVPPFYQQRLAERYGV